MLDGERGQLQFANLQAAAGRYFHPITPQYAVHSSLFMLVIISDVGQTLDVVISQIRAKQGLLFTGPFF